MNAVLHSCLCVGLLAALAGCQPDVKKSAAMKPNDSPASAPAITRTDAEWRQQLTPEQYRVLRQAGTEPSFGPGYEEFKTPTDQRFCINGVSLKFVPAGATSAVPAKAGQP